MNRRRFLTHATAALAAGTMSRAASAVAPTAGLDGLIDTNVWHSHWPTRHAWAETAKQLAAKLRSHGISSAWTGSFDAALHSDVAGANDRLAKACATDGAGLLVPIGCINPTLPDWEDDVRRCAEVHRMPGVRLLPNYHGYTLDDPRCARLLQVATQHRLLVQIAVTMEDERSQNPALTAAPVLTAPLPDLVENVPGARVMLLNSGSRVLGGNPGVLQRLTRAGVTFDIAMLEGVAGIEAILKKAPDVRLAFGSHAPYFYLEAALLKLQESALSAVQLSAVRQGHARAALART